MPRITVSEIKEEIECASAVIANLKSRGKNPKVIEERRKHYLLLLKKEQERKFPNRYKSDMEFISSTEAVIADLKSRGKNASQLESNLVEMRKALEARKSKHRLQRRRWAIKHKDSIKEYYKEWVKRNRIAVTDYMRSYRQMKREQTKDTTTHSSSAK
jgi:hypothetical protein